MTELPDKLPRHIAIIMDGNGRWAHGRGLPRLEGHRAGFKAAQTVVDCCLEWHIPLVTLFAFSTENWKRPQKEVDFLMSNLSRFLRERRKESLKKNVSFRAIGALDELPARARDELLKTIEQTRNGTGMTLNLALSYGSHQEILRAVRAIAHQVRSGDLDPDQIDEQTFRRNLYTGDLPDPDLLIRTGCEKRLSNFLLYQLWYCELYFTDAFWPDFGREQLLEALREFARRQRRFGGLEEDHAKAAGEASAAANAGKNEHV